MEIEVDLTAEESDLLAQCVALLRQVQHDMTHARLEVGRACYEIHVSRAERGFSERGTDILLADYLSRQSGENYKAGRLIKTYQVLHLLGSGNAGQLGWAVIFEFYPLVKRAGTKWFVTPGYENAGPALFARCRQLGWTVKRVNREVGNLVGRKTNQELRKAVSVTAMEDWYATMAGSNVRDVVDVVRSLVRMHPNREVLEDMLGRVFRRQTTKME